MCTAFLCSVLSWRSSRFFCSPISQLHSWRIILIQPSRCFIKSPQAGETMKDPLLLWSLFLAICSAALAFFARKVDARMKLSALAVQGGVSILFLAFMIFASNPFMRLDPAPFQGAGLNPILQDPALAIHPPILYAGYVSLLSGFFFCHRCFVARPRRKRLGAGRALANPICMDRADHRRRTRIVVGLSRARLGRILVLGPS